MEIPDSEEILEYDCGYLVSASGEEVQDDAGTGVHAGLEARNTRTAVVQPLRQAGSQRL